MSKPAARRTARARDADATREALITAATALFARSGFDGVRVDAIARDAGVNKAMINYYFGGKAGLYRAIIKATFAEITARLEALRHSSRPPLEVLSEYVAVVADIATRKRPSFPALFLREALEGAPRAREVAIPYLRAVIASVVHVIARGVRDGSFRPVDPLLTHLSIVGSLIFFFATEPMREAVLARARLPFPVPSAEAFVAHMQQLIVHGLASASAGRPAAKSTAVPPPRRGRNAKT